VITTLTLIGFVHFHAHVGLRSFLGGVWCVCSLHCGCSFIHFNCKKVF